MVARQVSSPLIVIVGETGSGKSALAIDLAEQFNGEIVSADSWAVYKEFDIATAKPTMMDQHRVPHYLIDIANPTEGFSAVIFNQKAKKAIADIARRGKIPFLVGGTGLYVDSLLFDYQFLPPSSAQLRQELSSLSLSELLAKVAQAEYDTSGIDLRNKRRVIRLLENRGKRPTKGELRSSTLILGVSLARDALLQRVEQRVDAMLQMGLEKEVEILSRRYGWEVEPMKGIGYREWQAYFLGTQTLEQTRDRIISSTMQLAKKQRTWFKRNSSIQWVNEKSKAVEIITAFLNK